MPYTRIIRITLGLSICLAAVVAVDAYELSSLEAIPLGFLSGLVGGIIAIKGDDY